MTQLVLPSPPGGLPVPGVLSLFSVWTFLPQSLRLCLDILTAKMMNVIVIIIIETYLWFFDSWKARKARSGHGRNVSHLISLISWPYTPCGFKVTKTWSGDPDVPLWFCGNVGFLPSSRPATWELFQRTQLDCATFRQGTTVPGKSRPT